MTEATSSALLTWPVARVRQTFLDFFAARHHTFIPGSSTIPQRDPTLLFVNAGMNQFKDIFLGHVQAGSERSALTRAVNTQACIRAGGKHNDLDDVGKDTYHHTLFEMLGNWSFADYFKREAIAWCYELLTQVYHLDSERLYATYFVGNDTFPADSAARDLWLQYLPASRVLPFDQDNIWEMGDAGPCGPCSEVHYDRYGNRDASALVNADDPTVIEIWNLVFMQYERHSDGSLTSLPQTHVDTGMGLERLVSILQHVHSNYDTDVWTGLFTKIQQVTQCPWSYAEALAKEKEGRSAHSEASEVVVAYRVVADHARCVTKALFDGAQPDSVGRGFVIRRIIRRAVRFGRQCLGAQGQFLFKLVPIIVEELSHLFVSEDAGEAKKRWEDVSETIHHEEKAFARTWTSGVHHFGLAVDRAAKQQDCKLRTLDVFNLHDRYGFPVDLTRIMAEAKGFSVDMDAFHGLMQRRREESKRASTFRGGGAAGKEAGAARSFLDTTLIATLQAHNISPTIDTAKYIGWADMSEPESPLVADTDRQHGCIVAIINKTDESNVLLRECHACGEGDSGSSRLMGLVLDCTNFYAEAGGQIYDTGNLLIQPQQVKDSQQEGIFEVRYVHSLAGFVVHVGQLLSGTIHVSDTVIDSRVDSDRRLCIAANHSTTHILNYVLRRVLTGVDVQQKGSYVGPELLRFDYSAKQKLTASQLEAIELKLREMIHQQTPVHRMDVSLSKAREIRGIRCLFDETYPDPCSVIAIGPHFIEELLRSPTNPQWEAEMAVELCGGTHLQNMSEAEDAIIVADEALQSGVRRLIVLTRNEAKRAQELANEFGYKLDELCVPSVEHLSTNGKTITPLNSLVELDGTIKALAKLSKEINDADKCPLLRKLSFRAEVEKRLKACNANRKVASIALRSKASGMGQRVAEETDENARVVSHLFEELGMERDALLAAIESFHTLRPRTMFFAVSSSGERALAFASVPTALHTSNFNAVSWGRSVLNKCGGRPHLAQGGLNAAEVKDLLVKAQHVAENSD